VRWFIRWATYKYYLAYKMVVGQSQDWEKAKLEGKEEVGK
jgi:hypothetical protein